MVGLSGQYGEIQLVRNHVRAGGWFGLLRSGRKLTEIENDSGSGE